MFNISVYKLMEGDHVDWYFFKKNFHVANLDSKSWSDRNNTQLVQNLSDLPILLVGFRPLYHTH